MSKSSLLIGLCLGAVSGRLIIRTLFSWRISENEALERAKRLVRDLGYEINGAWVVNSPTNTMIQGKPLQTLELGVMATDAYGNHHFHFQMDIYSGKLYVLTPHQNVENR
ncbi:hypothetical protein G4V62_04320 [Bacillaceae bacterium SIJ1]|uniref:hypothetical protein n=1 Tax=Litoribacterium kuwaitense TaxID=1398745 RepID=UPI0013EA11FD|nr:hypothetical protein [Litoribacterium kuwaitense]NGP44211.1 hypothetical protein [Litoribacterium kuwaitense]